MFDYPKTLLCPFCGSHIYDYMGDAPIGKESLTFVHLSPRHHNVWGENGITRQFIDGHFLSSRSIPF